MLTIWTFIARLFAWLYLRLGFYKYWSNIYRWLWERQYSDVQIHIFRRLSLLVDWIALQNWIPDGWKQLWDAVSSPQAVQVRGDDAKNHRIGDCDEFAIYAANAIDKALKLGAMVEDKIRRPQMLTVTWIEKDTWKTAGHNVCLLENVQEDGSVMFSYMDYKAPSAKRSSINAIATLICDTYVGKDKYIPVVWVVSDIDLTPRLAHWGV